MSKEVDNYLIGFEEEKRKILEEYRNIILNSSSELKEKISWGMPSYYLNKYIIHFAGNKNHVGVYPGDKAVVHFKDKLGKYSHKKGTIQIKYTDEIPKELIKEIIEYNIERDKTNKKSK
ncbi:iron chaperone [Miniphocaeibacter massiliensis]|uniref:iron chaperone n=1 Tax=Miniphocaeibacter massiliensis TaxID=2041841 RepID=UPI000C1BF930|nr:DUF1801 domain-containing protein [Miniphocaeibacter massiliensis]